MFKDNIFIAMGYKLSLEMAWTRSLASRLLGFDAYVRISEVRNKIACFSD